MGMDPSDRLSMQFVSSTQVDAHPGGGGSWVSSTLPVQDHHPPALQDFESLGTTVTVGVGFAITSQSSTDNKRRSTNKKGSHSELFPTLQGDGRWLSASHCSARTGAPYLAPR